MNELPEGNYRGTILRNGAGRYFGDKFVWVEVDVKGFDPFRIRIRLNGDTPEKTAKALRMAKMKLSLCGFPGGRVVELIDNPTLLAGKIVPIESQMRAGKVYVDIAMSGDLTAADCANIDEALAALDKPTNQDADPNAYPG